jgi:putative FmdB family regulatory protein
MYTFACEDCNVEFLRTLKMAEHLTHECPSCGRDAPRVWDADSLAFAFKGSQTGATANTGVHDNDYPTADKLVGRDAEVRWAEIHEREKVKAEARKQGGTHALIRHNNRDYIDYEPMSDGGRTARRNLAKVAIDSVRAQRGPGGEHR